MPYTDRCAPLDLDSPPIVPVGDAQTNTDMAMEDGASLMGCTADWITTLRQRLPEAIGHSDGFGNA